MRLKGEENTVAKLEEQLNLHKDSVKERKANMVAVKTELDAAVVDLNDARQREQEDEDSPDEEVHTSDGAMIAQGAQMA